MSTFAFYTVVGFAPEPFVVVRVDKHAYSSSSRARSYEDIKLARSARTRAQRIDKRPNVFYRILETTVTGAGFTNTRWVD
jgi:hypothetical protein